MSAPLLACLPGTWEGSILHLCGPVALTGLIAALFAGPTLLAPLAHRNVAPVVLCVLLATVDITYTVKEHAPLKALYGNNESLNLLPTMFILGSTLAAGKYVYSQVVYSQVTQQVQPSPRFWPPVLCFIAVRWAHCTAVIEFDDHILALNALHGCALWYCLWSNVEVTKWYHAPICFPARLAWAAMRGWGKAVGWLWRFIWDPVGTVYRTFTPRDTQAVLKLQLELELKKIELQLRNTPQSPPRSPPRSPPKSPPRARGRPRKSVGNVLSLEQAIHKAPHREVKHLAVTPLVVKPPVSMRVPLFKPLELPLEHPVVPQPQEAVDHMVTEKAPKKRSIEAKSPARHTRTRARK